MTNSVSTGSIYWISDEEISTLEEKAHNGDKNSSFKLYQYHMFVSLNQDLEFNENKPAIKAIFETDFTKEIRILMRENQEMKEHQTPFPIVVELLEGEIIFGVEGQNYEVKKGDLLTLSGGVPHNLIAKKESVIRLTLSKLDSSKRVEGVAEKS